MRKILGTVIVTSVLVAGATGLTACSDDSGDAKASAPKLNAATVKYCGELKKVGETFTDPGIDKIFEQHPNPTLAEWAAFLPTPVAGLRKFADDVEAIDQPAGTPDAISTNVAGALAAIREAADHYEAEIPAAEAGDQKTFDSEGEAAKAMAPKIGKSFNAVGAACGFPQQKQ